MISILRYAYRLILRTLTTLLGKAFGHTEFLEILKTFFAEAAVLVLVFPLLDYIAQSTNSSISWHRVVGTLVLSISGAFWGLFAAGLIADIIKKRQ